MANKNVTIETTYWKFELPAKELSKLQEEIKGNLRADIDKNNKLNVRTSYWELIVPANEVNKLKKEIRREVDKIRSDIQKKTKEKHTTRYKDLDKEDKLDAIKLYKWGKKGKRLKKDEVMGIVGSLKLPYKYKFTRYIKNGDIKWLQKQINKMIDNFGKTNGNIENLKIYLEWQGLSLDKDNHIAVDWKLWQQTMNALEHLDHNMDIKNISSDIDDEYRYLWSSDEKKSYIKEAAEYGLEEVAKYAYNQSKAKQEQKKRSKNK